MNKTDFNEMDTNDLIDYTMNELDQLRGKGGANPEELEEIQELLEIIEQRYDEKDAQWQFECGCVEELMSKQDRSNMTIYDMALNDIEVVKDMIKSMRYQDAYTAFCGFNYEQDSFEFDSGCIQGRIVNDNGYATIPSDCVFTIWNKNGTVAMYKGTEKDIMRVRNLK